jgi:hypothetical protein
VLIGAGNRKEECEGRTFVEPKCFDVMALTKLKKKKRDWDEYFMAR